MSELFKWLSKTEAKRRVVPPAINPVATVLQEKMPNESDLPIHPSNASKELFSQAKFNLDLADQRIKTVLDPRTLVGEQFRFLRARLGQLQQQVGFKKLLITSSIPGEGKTFIACCLAGILAQEPDKRVLLMDADLRKPTITQNLGLEGDGAFMGLTQILQHTCDLNEALLRSSSMDFFYLPAGKIPDNPSELLASDNLEQTIQKASELFDWIIIDSPPVMTVADPMRLAPLCDTILFVVRVADTPAKMIQKSIQLVGSNLVCGIVLNRMQNLNTSRYYYSYYHGKKHRTKQAS